MGSFRRFCSRVCLTASENDSQLSDEILREVLLVVLRSDSGRVGGSCDATSHSHLSAGKADRGSHSNTGCNMNQLHYKFRYRVPCTVCLSQEINVCQMLCIRNRYVQCISGTTTSVLPPSVGIDGEGFVACTEVSHGDGWNKWNLNL